MNAVARYFAAASLAVWIGGLTFYALVVIPAGNDLVGGINQGLITQRVTGWLNLIGLASLAVLIPTLRRGWMAATWAVLAVTLAALFAIHPQLDALIDGKAKQISDYATFYHWHQAYLLGVTVQWFAGVAHLWGVVQSTSTTLPASVT